MNNGDYDYDYNNMKKIFVNCALLIFGFVCLLIFILLILYYFTPNNYELIKWNNNKNNFIYLNQAEIVLKPYSTINLKKYLNLNPNPNPIETRADNYFRISTRSNIIFKNLFKSQNVYVEGEDELFASNYDILITNDTDKEKKITIYLYKKK